MFHDWKKQSARFLPALTLLSVLLFSNCSPQKRLIKTQEQRKNSTHEQLAANREITHDSIFFRELCEALREQLAIERTRNRTTAEDIETVTREYDTSRPADTLTGKPPLLRETTQRRHRSDSVQDSSRLRQTQARDTRTAAGSMTQEQDQLHLRGESDQQTATDTATTTKSRRGLTWWQKALCFVGLLSLTYIFYRFFKNK